MLLTMLAMCAFAANSVLNRMAVAGGAIDPVAFAVVRLVAGALALAGVVLVRRGLRRGSVIWAGWQGRFAGVAGLLVYLMGFSLAYGGLDAGTGALILFGVVQVTMFAGALVAREGVPRQRWAGAVLAFAGLVMLLWPGDAAISPWHAGLMMGAGAGWGIYSLAGRRAGDPVAATAANFALGVPVMLCLLPWLPMAVPMGDATAWGIWLAVLSGVVTSGMGYALWYGLVPQLGAARAALAQLTVPVIAAAAGLVWLDEPVGWRFTLAAGLVLGGVALGSVQRARVIR